MRRILNVLTHTRTLSIIGLLALAAVLFIGADTLQIDPMWPAIVLGAVIALWLLVWVVRRLRARRANNKLGEMLEQQAEKQTETGPAPTPARQAELDVLRTRLVDAVKTIKTSKIGQMSGGSALYELPWYIVIGNPAAGKSSAVLNSGLQFPFADKNNAVIHGIGGTRNATGSSRRRHSARHRRPLFRARGRPHRMARLPWPAQTLPAESADQRHHRHGQHCRVDRQQARVRDQSCEEPAPARAGVD
jgi:Uncharacterized protein conserved in bacteria